MLRERVLIHIRLFCEIPYHMLNGKIVLGEFMLSLKYVEIDPITTHGGEIFLNALVLFDSEFGIEHFVVVSNVNAYSSRIYKGGYFRIVKKVCRPEPSPVYKRYVVPAVKICGGHGGENTCIQCSGKKSIEAAVGKSHHAEV